ncbi:unnamed protein product [Lactuca virosa]|uniref:Uncharacterized protein n=1 Tax=Lactuca virosa TaxID=75947 RepID=A0AAU9NC81_9ASTR|nr:unnamed protein product [Lactuca virosa]
MFYRISITLLNYLRFKGLSFYGAFLHTDKSVNPIRKPKLEPAKLKSSSMCSSIQSSSEHYTTSNSIVRLDYTQETKNQTSNFTSYSFSNSLWQQFTSDSMENLTSENENKMTNIVEISEEDVHGVQSPTPATRDNEKNPKPVKQLKPQKTGVDVKRHRKLTSEISAAAEDQKSRRRSMSHHLAPSRTRASSKTLSCFQARFSSDLMCFHLRSVYLLKWVFQQLEGGGKKFLQVSILSSSLYYQKIAV